jgi:hypothetical protein
MGEDEDFSELALIRKCPICKKEMRKGYVVSPHNIWWDVKKHKSGVGDSEELTHGIPWFMRNLPSLRCDRSEIVTLSCRMGKPPKAHLKQCIKCGRALLVDLKTCPNCGARQTECEGHE